MQSLETNLFSFNTYILILLLISKYNLFSYKVNFILCFLYKIVGNVFLSDLTGLFLFLFLLFLSNNFLSTIIFNGVMVHGNPFIDLVLFWLNFYFISSYRISQFYFYHNFLQ